MKRLAWLALAVAVFYAHPSHAVSMALCPDNAHYYPVSEGVGYCPPQISITGTAPTATGATVSGTVSIATGTVFVSVRLNCDAVHWRDVVDSIGDEAYGTDATVTDGTFLVEITGLAESTAYCAHASQYVTSNRPAKAATQAFTTTDATPPAEGIGDEITGGDDWFYCPDGSNANSGLTHAQRRATLPSTDTSVMSGGDDMWLCTGGNFVTQPITIARAGTSENWSEMGTYYMDSSTPRKGVDGVMGLGATHTKATLSGGLSSVCIAARTCTFPSSGFPLDGLGSTYGVYISVAATADYHHLQNIRIDKSRYGNVIAAGTSPNSAGTLHHVIFDGLDCTDGGWGPCVAGTDGVTDFVVRNGAADKINLCEGIRFAGTSADTSACNGGGWPGGYAQVTRSTGARFLFEGNQITRAFGEGFGCFASSSTRGIIRGNRSSNLLSGAVYVDGCPGIVVEQNIFLGGDGKTGAWDFGAPGFVGVAIGSESTSFPNATGNVVRNNLIVGVQTGIQGEQYANVAVSSDTIGAKLSGNTVIDSENYDVRVYQSNVAEWAGVNNVSWNEDLSAADVCQMTSVPDWSDSHWYSSPTDTDCQGVGDTTGTPGLTVSSYATWQGLGAQDGDPSTMTWPTFADANPAGGSVLLASGTALTSSILDIADYGFAWEQIADVLDASLTESEWEAQNTVDALGATRASPPSKGAVE